LAVLLVWGCRLWPAVFVGAFVVNVIKGTFATTWGIAAGNTLEAVVGAWLVQRFAGGLEAFVRPQTVVRFFALAAVLSTMVSATVGVTSLCFGGLAPWKQFGAVWLTWWMGDMVSDVLVAPLLLIWLTFPRPRLTRNRILEAGALLLVIAVVGAVIFPATIPTLDRNIPIDYVALLPMLWAAIRFGQRGAATAAIVTSAIALAGTLYGYGPFVKPDPSQSLLLLQAFVGTITVTALLLAAISSDRTQATAALAAKEQELEKTVAERTAELRETNAELEAFSYSLSHDLRAPLRSIRGYTTLAFEEHHAEPGAAAAHLERVIQATDRMDRLIQDVLAFSRVSRQQIIVEPVDVEQLVRGIVQERQELQPPRAEVEIHGPLLLVRGDQASLTQCVTNLLDNAVKFTAQGVIPRIRVRGEQARERVRFWFEDNGIGIEAEAQSKIFDLFQRGHADGTYEGTGIGLAIVRRAVERMAGQVGVESAVGAGSRFWIELPKA
jgi:signal transduction histidine kinase